MTITYDAQAGRLTTVVDSPDYQSYLSDQQQNIAPEKGSDVVNPYASGAKTRPIPPIAPAMAICTMVYSPDGLTRITQEPGGSIQTAIWDKPNDMESKT